MRRYRTRSTGLARVPAAPSAPARTGLSAMLALAGIQSTGLACLASTVILADVSGSMFAGAADGSYAEDRKSRLDVLGESLMALGGGTVIPFDHLAHPPVDPATMIADAKAYRHGGGGTDYIEAFQAAAAHNPSAVLLTSDGTSGQGEAAVRAAVKLGVPVHTMYIGPPGCFEAIGLLRRIAEATGGNFTDQDLGTGVLALTAAIQSTLCLAQNAGADGQAIAL